MSTSSQKLIEDIFLGFCLTSICVLGILANLITLLVLCHQQRKSKRNTVNYFLIGLSACDTLFLFTWLNVGILYAHRLFGEDFPEATFSSPAAAYFSLVTRPIGYIGQAGGSMFTVAISIDRFLAVCHTLLAKRFWTQARALYVSIGIALVAIIFAVPIWFALEVDFKSDGQVYIVTKNAFGKSAEFASYNLWLYTSVNTIIPFPLLVVLNGFIYKKVHEAREAQSSMSRSQISEISLAKMLLCVVLVFGICNLPSIFRAIVFSGSDKSDLIRLSEAGRVEKYFPYTILRIVNWLCIAINSGTNFLIYCVMSRQFRKSLLDLFSLGIFKVRRLFVPGVKGQAPVFYSTTPTSQPMESTSNDILAPSSRA